MASRMDRRGEVKTGERVDAGEAEAMVRDRLEELARDGARRILTEALNEEVAAGGGGCPVVSQHDQPADQPVQGSVRGL